MKKVGLTLEDDVYDYIVKIAEKNDVAPTTLCRLIIESRVQFYHDNFFEPVFTKKFVETKKSSLPNDQRTPSAFLED